MDNQNFGTEKLIVEIENRPAIWNSASNDYSNRDVTKNVGKNWSIFNKNENCTPQEKKRNR